MKAKKRFLIATCAVLLVVPAVIIGVYAALAETFTVSSSLNYVGKGNVTVYLQTSSYNGGNMLRRASIIQVGKTDQNNTPTDSFDAISFSNVHRTGKNAQTGQSEYTSDPIKFETIIWNRSTELLNINLEVEPIEGVQISYEYSTVGTATITGAGSGQQINFTAGLGSVFNPNTDSISANSAVKIAVVYTLTSTDNYIQDADNVDITYTFNNIRS